MREEDLCELILENAHVITCFNCGEMLESQTSIVANNTMTGILHIEPGERNYPYEPDTPPSAFFECVECNHYGTDAEINKLEQRVKELENACVHYSAREDQLVDMLQRIAGIAEEEDQYDAM